MKNIYNSKMLINVSFFLNSIQIYIRETLIVILNSKSKCYILCIQLMLQVFLDGPFLIALWYSLTFIYI